MTLRIDLPPRPPSPSPRPRPCPFPRPPAPLAFPLPARAHDARRCERRRTSRWKPSVERLVEPVGGASRLVEAGRRRSASARPRPACARFRNSPCPPLPARTAPAAREPPEARQTHVLFYQDAHNSRPGNRPYASERDQPGSPARASEFHSPTAGMCFHVSGDFPRASRERSLLQKGERARRALYHPRKRPETLGLSVSRESGDSIYEDLAESIRRLPPVTLKQQPSPARPREVCRKRSPILQEAECFVRAGGMPRKPSKFAWFYLDLLGQNSRPGCVRGRALTAWRRPKDGSV